MCDVFVCVLLLFLISLSHALLCVFLIGRDQILELRLGVLVGI